MEDIRKARNFVEAPRGNNEPDVYQSAPLLQLFHKILMQVN